MQSLGTPFSSAKPVRFKDAVCALSLIVLLGLRAANAHAWGLDDVAALADQRAKAPFHGAPKSLPAELANLDYDGYRDIRFNRDAPIWRNNKLPFEANFFQSGARWFRCA